jgi:hypothetical protein
MKVTAPQTDPREGVYRITGELSGEAVDITWDLYRDDLSFGGDGFSGFVDGIWLDGPIRTSANAGFTTNPPPGTSPGSIPSFVGQIYGAESDPLFPGQVGNGYTLTGTRAEKGTSFPLLVAYSRSGRDTTGVVTAIQVSGP